MLRFLRPEPSSHTSLSYFWLIGLSFGSILLMMSGVIYFSRSQVSPESSASSTLAREVVTLIQQLAREYGCATLMVTHDNRILDIADRIVKMEDGRLLSSNSLQVEEART